MRQILIRIIKSMALEVKPPGEFFTLKSGKKSRFYLDIRKAALHSEGLPWIVQEIHTNLQKNGLLGNCDAIGGPSLGADPIVGGLLCKLYGPVHTYRGFLVRPAPKDHGHGGLIVGSIMPNDRCVVVDDVTTSGGSLIHAIDAVRAAGGQVIQALTVVDRCVGGGNAVMARDVPFQSLLTVRDLGIEEE